MFDLYLKDVEGSISSLQGFLFYIQIMYFFILIFSGVSLYFIPFSTYTGIIFLAVRKIREFNAVGRREIFVIISPHILSMLVLQRELQKYNNCAAG